MTTLLDHVQQIATEATALAEALRCYRDDPADDAALAISFATAHKLGELLSPDTLGEDLGILLAHLAIDLEAEKMKRRLNVKN